MSQGSETPVEVKAPVVRSGVGAGVGILIFVLGIALGFPVAIFGLDFFLENATSMFGLLFALLFVVVVATVLLLIFREQIWQKLFRYGQVEMHRFADPMAEVARAAAQQNVDMATSAARQLAEMMLARYAWTATRRWLIATITGFIAAIAALAGAALLFQQNQLLRVQSGLMQDQTDRMVEQTALLEAQIELGEAQRSVSIVPEILAIGQAIGEETGVLEQDGRGAAVFEAAELSNGLRARIIAATSAARPYRYLRAGLTGMGDMEINVEALSRRQDLVRASANIERWRRSEAEIFGVAPDNARGTLTDRPVSPERGQLLSLLIQSRVMDTEILSFYGADFSFAEPRLGSLAGMSLRHATLRYADFSRSAVTRVEFGAAFLEGARFRNCTISNTSFSGLSGDELKPPFDGDGDIGIWRTILAGTDFSGAVISDSGFVDANALAANFDGAVLVNVDFTGASISASTFRSAIIGTVNFAGADLTGVDFDRAVVFDGDFLSKLAAEAAPDSFDADLFSISPIDAAEVGAHPRGTEAYRVPGNENEDKQAYRITRIGAFS